MGVRTGAGGGVESSAVNVTGAASPAETGGGAEMAEMGFETSAEGVVASSSATAGGARKAVAAKAAAACWVEGPLLGSATSEVGRLDRRGEAAAAVKGIDDPEGGVPGDGRSGLPFP